MAKRAFVPDSYKNRHDWSANYSTGVSAVATRIGWPTASVTTLTAQLTSLTTATPAVLDAQHALDTAVGQLNALKGSALAQIRAETKSLKATHGFTEGDAKTLGVYTTPETFDPNFDQPTLEATSRHDYVELMGEEAGGRQPESLLASRWHGDVDDALAQAGAFPVPRRHAAACRTDHASPRIHGDGRHRRRGNRQPEQHRECGVSGMKIKFLRLPPHTFL